MKTIAHPLDKKKNALVFTTVVWILIILGIFTIDLLSFDLSVLIGFLFTLLFFTLGHIVNNITSTRKTNFLGVIILTVPFALFLYYLFSMVDLVFYSFSLGILMMVTLRPALTACFGLFEVMMMEAAGGRLGSQKSNNVENIEVR